MPTPKDAIKEALLSLDHKNDDLWTDDGSPLVSEIQRLANDKTITRAQINEALPGFARKTDDSIAEDEQPGDEDDIGGETGGINAASTETIAPASEVQADDVELSPEQEHERLRALAFRRVQDAEAAVRDAKDNVSKALAAVTAAEQRHSRALVLFSAKYPPLTAAANIKQHLARQQEILRERVTGSRFEPNVAQNPVDATMMDRKRNNGRNNKGQAPAKFLPRSLAVGG
jgi:hypothetical protein